MDYDWWRDLRDKHTSEVFLYNQNEKLSHLDCKLRENGKRYENIRQGKGLFPCEQQCKGQTIRNRHWKTQGTVSTRPKLMKFAMKQHTLPTTQCFLHALQKPLRRNLRGKALKGVSLYLRNRARLRWLAFSDLRFRSEKSEAMFCIVRQQTHSGFVAQELTRTEDEEWEAHVLLSVCELSLLGERCWHLWHRSTNMCNLCDWLPLVEKAYEDSFFVSWCLGRGEFPVSLGNGCWLCFSFICSRMISLLFLSKCIEQLLSLQCDT